MIRFSREHLRFVLTVLAGIALFAVCAAPLPGEVTGCGGDTSGKVNASSYCYERCATEAQRFRECGEIPDTDLAQEQQEQFCAESRQCESPLICTETDNYHISNQEASQCMDAILSADCDVDLSENPPAECTEAVLCDPR